ncbi:MAG: hypothetical protein ACR2PX_02315 [Endozoicomonas sp.]|uniref:hypothetical protein n=1 Tax=Endozoicomonas sp. TaxID=1892382 RepID=UPI003D9B4C69
MEFKKIAVAMAVSVGLGASSVMAATDGTIGETSNGNFDINFQKGTVARIWGLGDFNLTDANVAATPATEDICIYSNKAANSNTYQLEIASTNSFRLVGSGSDASTFVDYDIKVEGLGIGNGSLDNASVNHGTDANVTSQAGNHLDAGALASQPDPSIACTGENAQISVWLPASVASLAGGAFSDTVTLTITPQ